MFNNRSCTRLSGMVLGKTMLVVVTASLFLFPLSLTVLAALFLLHYKFCFLIT